MRSGAGIGTGTGTRRCRPTIRYVTSIEDELRDRDRGEVGLQYLRIDYMYIPPLAPERGLTKYSFLLAKHLCTISN
jgi:hypothetical protein